MKSKIIKKKNPVPEPVVKTFEVVAGKHEEGFGEDKVVYQAGDQLESSLPLDVLFKNKFKEVIPVKRKVSVKNTKPNPIEEEEEIEDVEQPTDDETEESDDEEVVESEDGEPKPVKKKKKKKHK